MQFNFAKPALGVVYNTTMSRPDAALALAMLYGLEGKKEMLSHLVRSDVPSVAREAAALLSLSLIHI